MRRFLRSRFFLISLCIVLLLSASALFAAFTERISPVQEAVSGAVQPAQQFFSRLRFAFSDFYNTFTLYDTLKAENEALSMRISELEAQTRQYKILEAENETLRQLLSMKTRNAGINYLPTSILAAASSGWDEHYTLSCGSADGIAAGMCAVTTSGLVGFISQCAETTCVLRPITAAGASCSARSVRTQAVGILEGSFTLQDDGLVRLSYLDKNEDIQTGDIIETAGVGGIYPAGIAIGLVCEVGLEEHALSSYALVRPFAVPDGQRQVYIITGFRGD